MMKVCFACVTEYSRVSLSLIRYHEFRSGNVGGAGLGANPSQADADDDEFDSYRKRMMLAYRFRPNPLVRPD